MAVLGLSIDKGAVQFAAPLAFYRQYGIFKTKKGGFSISGGYSQTGPGGTSGESGGLGGGGCSFDLGDLPVDIGMHGEEVVVRGQSHIMTFDPRVMLVQWSAIFSKTEVQDRTLLRTGRLPMFSQKDVSYYLTEMPVGRGRDNRDQFMILGLAREDGKVRSPPPRYPGQGSTTAYRPWKRPGLCHAGWPQRQYAADGVFFVSLPNFAGTDQKPGSNRS